MLGLWANDMVGLGHRVSGIRIILLLVGGPLLGAILAKRIISEASSCSIPLLTAAALAGLFASAMAAPHFEKIYVGSAVARWVEMVFVFLGSCLAATTATYYRTREP